MRRVWTQTLATIEKRIGAQAYKTWFRPLMVEFGEGGTITIKVPNELFKAAFLDGYSEILYETLKACSSSPATVSIVTDPALSPMEAKPVRSKVARNPEDSTLISRFTFDTFVEGSCNQFARAAALAVAELPSRAYNPLFIYGGVGLGKTHLMHAVGHTARKKNNAEICYVSAEKFMNELINCIRTDRMMDFRQKYRKIDILLIDDIQFMAGKECTQEEFFHTFNALYDEQKQIVISSDCPPRQIPTLEERLHSRFEWGLIADIQPPNLETKAAILRKKCESESIQLPDDVTMFIAGSVRSNIRELEGALNRLVARASFDGIRLCETDAVYAQAVLQGLVHEGAGLVSPDVIMRAVCNHFSLKPAQLKARNNAKAISEPRQIAMYLCKEMTQLSLPQIGKEFGNKHHTTVLHSVRKIDLLRKKDPRIAGAIARISSSMK